jgi:hypothetical protein
MRSIRRAGIVAAALAAGLMATAVPTEAGGVATPAAPTTGTLNSVACTSSTSCEAVGSKGTSEEALAEYWNGTTWTVQSTPDPAGGSNVTLAGVACGSADACVAVGGYFNGHGNTFLAETWNGSTWSIQTVPLPAGGLGGGLASVSCSAPTSCTAVGVYADSSNTNLPYAASWNGTSFSVESVPFPATGSLGTLDAVSCSPAPSKDCEAEGWYFISGAGEIATTLGEGWNGTAWSIQATPVPDGAEGGAYPFGLSCHKATSCVSVGEGTNGEGGLGFGWAQVWNGSTWSDLTTTAPAAATGSVLSSISCSAAPSTKCTAVGYYTNGSTFLGYAQRISGSSVSLQTTRQPAGFTEALLNGVSCSSPPATCSAVGTVTNKTGVAVTLANGWNGKAWSLQKTPNP